MFMVPEIIITVNYLKTLMMMGCLTPRPSPPCPDGRDGKCRSLRFAQWSIKVYRKVWLLDDPPRGANTAEVVHIGAANTGLGNTLDT